MDEIYVYCVAMPDRCNEAVLPCCDGYTVYINEKLDEAHRSRALEHAIRHILNRDWERASVQEIENSAHTEIVEGSHGKEIGSNHD